MNLNILEARKFITKNKNFIDRKVKDYEIDMECTFGRKYSCNSSKTQQLSFGDILIRKPGDHVSTYGAQNSYILTLDFSGRVLRDMYSRNINGEFQSICEDETIVRLEPIIHPTHTKEIMNIYQNIIALPDKNSLFAKELVHQLIYTLNAEILKKNYELLKPQATISETIITYMQENLNHNITLDQLSKLVHREKSYLVRLFRNETGKTPIEALIEMRLTLATDLVATTELSIGQIAEQCGYNTVSFFISKYKQYHGMTPEEHRYFIKENQST